MTVRMVDVFLNGGLVKSYRIQLEATLALSDHQFIAAAKESMAQDGYSEEDIHVAHFLVRFF